MTTIRFRVHLRLVLVTLAFLLATNAQRQRICSAFQIAPTTTTVRHPRQFQVAPTIASRRNDITITIRAPVTTSRSSRSSSLWLLPTTSASTLTSVSVPRVAVTAGMIGLFSQLLLTRIFQQRRSKRLQQDQHGNNQNNNSIAAYTAHNVIAFFLMLLVSYIGVSGWCGVRGGTPTQLNFATERILTHNNKEIATTVQWLASTIFGMFVFWDIPTSVAVKQLRNWDVIIHHVVMALVALLGATKLPTCYLLFFLGVSELSSLPLIVYDQLSTMAMVLTQENEKISQTLQNYRDKAQIVAAISFTWIRAILFPKVVFGHFLPDVWYVLSSSKAAPKSLLPVLWFGIAATVGFTLLQWMWFVRMVKSVVIGKIPPVWMNRDNENANDQDDSILALLFDP